MPKISRILRAKLAVFALPFTIFSVLLLLLAMAPARSAAPAFLLAVLGVAIMGALASHAANPRRKATDTRQQRPDTPDACRKTIADSSEAAPADLNTPARPVPPSRLLAGEAEMVLLSRNRENIAILTECLQTWGRSCAVVASSVEATCRLLNQYEQTKRGPKTLIVDATGLDMDPVHLPALLAREAGLSDLRLFCLCHPKSPATVASLHAAGYTGLIDSPIRKSQLFDLLESNPNKAFPAGNNVIELSRHRLKRIHPKAKKHILLAEQSLLQRTRLEGLLREAGHRVKSVENGEQALDAMERHHFDLAVIDLRLPIMNGTQVIKLHRFTTPHQLWVPFVMITDQNTPAILKLCRELSILACLFKPVPSEALLDTIASAPAAASAPRDTRHVGKVQETRFLHPDLLDRRILQALDRLDHGTEFLPELIEVFERDCGNALGGMQEAVELHQAERFMNLAGVILDNAGQLGAFALYEVCLGIARMGLAEFDREAGQRLLRLTEVISMTSRAFQDYLAERRASQSDSN